MANKKVITDNIGGVSTDYAIEKIETKLLTLDDNNPRLGQYADSSLTEKFHQFLGLRNLGGGAII